MFTRRDRGGENNAVAFRERLKRGLVGIIADDDDISFVEELVQKIFILFARPSRHMVGFGSVSWHG